MAGEIELNIEASNKEITEFAIKKIDEEETRLRAEMTTKLNMLEQRKKELLCIGFDGHPEPLAED